MFRPNSYHLQMPSISSISQWPEAYRERLHTSWAGTFDALRFNLQLRYSVGLWDLGVDDFELRTVYNFRRRLTQLMQETGENLLDQAFEHVTDAQLAAFGLRTDKQRMDSTFVASHIREMSRRQLLVEVLQRVQRMLRPKEAHTDGGDNGQAADAAAATHDVLHIQTVLRGAQPSAERVALAEFAIAPADRGTPDTLPCPQGQTAPVSVSRKHLKAAFDINQCRDCPLFGTRCPVDAGRHRQYAVLRFSPRQIDVARRRQRCAAERASEHPLRPAIEATVRSVKHPFPGGKLPVRGRIRMRMLLIGPGAMTNVRRIHRHLSGRNRPNSAKPTTNPWPKPNQPGAQPFRSKLETPMRRLLRWFQGLSCPMPSRLPWAITP